MNRYWLRIGIGVALVFVLGLSAMAAVRKGKAEVRSFLSSVGTRLPLQLANLKFRFDGRSLGSITGIDVQRSQPTDTGRVKVRVALTDAADLEPLRACSLTLDRRGDRSSVTGFRCADAAEIDGGSLVKAGEVVFEPGSVTRPLMVEQRDMARWQHSNIRSLDASMATRPNGGVQARGSYDVRNHGMPERGSFTLMADSQGAVISVRDDRGRSLVDFRADQKGVNLNIRDKYGRNLMRLLADSLGAALNLHQ